MKKTILLALLSVCTFLLNAQVVEKSMTMSSGEQPGLEVDLKGDSKTSEKLWKEYVKPYGKTDWDRKNKEHVLFNVHIPAISSKAITLVVRFNQYQDMTKGSFWVKDDSGFLNSDENVEAIRGAGEFLQGYAHEVERHAIREDIKRQEKDLSKFEKDLEKLMKKNRDYHKDIEKAKAEIAKKEGEIEKNLVEQKNKKGEIEKKRNMIQETTIALSKIGKGS